MKNFASLELGRHLTRTERNWLITIPAAETKTNQPIAFDLPETLLPWFERYLSEVRVAVSARGQIVAGCGSARTVSCATSNPSVTASPN